MRDLIDLITALDSAIESKFLDTTQARFIFQEQLRSLKIKVPASEEEKQADQENQVVQQS